MQHRWILLTLFLSLAASDSATGKESSTPRARPPQWPQTVREVFFHDVREHLVGDRPSPSDNTNQAVSTPEETSTGKNHDWSTLVNADTLTAEIKRLVNRVTRTVSRTSAFKSEGHLLCQRDFRLLALWFGIVGEFDEEIRWQRNAEAMRAYLLAAAAQCSSGNEEGLSVAQETNETLAELMRGQTPSLPPSTNSAANEEPAELSEIMQRMEQATKEKIAPALATGREFRKGRHDIVHEAQVVAVLARVIQQEGFDYSEEESYAQYAQQLEKSALDLTQAASDATLDTAEQASSLMKQSCAACHEDFRG